MKLFIEIRNGQPFGHPHIQESLKYLSEGFRASLVEVIPQERPPVPFTHVCEELPQYEFGPDGLVYQQWVVREWTAEERAAATQEGQAAHESYIRGTQQMRSLRNTRLTACDWTQLPDAQLTQDQRTAWSSYRQALRDAPQQSGFPWNVVWPTPPQ